MTSIDSVIIEADDTEAAAHFYASAFGLGPQVRVQPAEEASAGFRGFTLSLITSQPADVDALFEAAVAEGATAIKPAAKSLWGYGGVVQAPDGTIWQIASSSKKNKEPASKKVDDIVLLLGVADMAESKKFYVGQGVPVAKSFGSKYVEFEAGAGAVKLALYKRRNLAKVAGVAPEGSGSHRIAVGGDAGAFTDPDGFTWEARVPSA
ncbi:glyoxalase [Streptomyces sp. VRA16 Mangrove soil]|uniref:glyoxalase n=1 Tax=Streptomyces sp. VRA16 Mangrove soil TaxID=2817434 RepID=UPI001A9CDA60|nr:glyoxalase [Streptomyces sp. VRA16 Mangrove soil]MBO1331524.1 glyoxalase [Streptomyces sp. VRA16 Mangrove soil]